MKVIELIERLEKFDPEMECVAYGAHQERSTVYDVRIERPEVTEYSTDLPARFVFII